MEDNQSKIINKLNDLYIIQRGHYLIQNTNGYSQLTSGQINKSGKKAKGLMDWHFEKHLNGDFTIGTFGGKYKSKFLTFDVDFHDPETAKWITYKVANTLSECGINDFFISYSGGKGYHIDLFFEDLIQIKHARKFFDYIIDKSGVLPHSDDGNKVEFRVTDKQGVKLPLGIHQKTGRYCGFCSIEDGLKVMEKESSESYLLTMRKIKHRVVLDILNLDDDFDINKKEIVKTEDAISPHTPLLNYEQSEDMNIDRAQDLLLNGLKANGSRNNSAFLIGLYLKYQGYSEEECINELYGWMNAQNTNLYSTPLEECYKEINKTVKNTYEKNYNMTVNVKDLTVSYQEIKWIIENCSEKNQKLITYAMLIHSKRHANKKGIFFMSFKDIEKVTGLYNQAIQNQINKLASLGIIEVVERDRKVKGKVVNGKCNLPNLYRIDTGIEQSFVADDLFIVGDKTDFKSCIKYYFTDKQLKGMFPRRQYESIVV